MIRVGIIGCGKVAQVRHLPEYHERKDVELVGYYDLNNERAQGISKKYGGKVYDNYEALLADDNIDAVSVLTTNQTHAEITIAALKAGKHVLCEKPMATTLNECQSMVNAAEKYDRVLMVGHNQRLAKAHVKAKELIEEGLIGKLISFQTNFGHSGPDEWSLDGANSWFFDRERASFGALADLGIHKTDLIHFLTGQRIVAVNAWIGSLDKKTPDGKLISVDDNAICIYELSDGCVGTMTASWTRYGKEDNSTTIYGSEGQMLIYGDPEHSIIVDLKDGERILYNLDKIQTNIDQTKSGVIDVFINGIKDGKPTVLSAEESLCSMRAVFAAVESSKQGRTIAIDW